MNALREAFTYSAPRDEHSGLETYPRWTFVALGAVALVAGVAVLFGT